MSLGVGHNQASRLRRNEPLIRIANVALKWNENDAARVLDWLKAIHPDGRPDIVTIQKTGHKKHFPEKDLREIDYESCCAGGRRPYLGVAVLSHRDLPQPEVVDFGLPDATQGKSRFLTVRIGRLQVASVYAPYRPNGLTRKPDIIAERVAWLNQLRHHVAKEGYSRQDALLCGDFNVKFEADGRREGMYGPEDEDALQEILNLGFVDLYRDTHPDPKEKPGHTRGYDQSGIRPSRLHLMLASHSLAQHRRDIWLDLDASPRPRRDAPPLVVDLDGLEV